METNHHIWLKYPFRTCQVFKEWQNPTGCFRFVVKMLEFITQAKKHLNSSDSCFFFFLLGHFDIYRASQKKLPLCVLFNISGTKEQNYKPFSPTENWNQYPHFEHRTIYVQFKGAEILTKKNWILDKGNCNNLLFSHLNSEVFWKRIKINMN